MRNKSTFALAAVTGLVLAATPVSAVAPGVDASGQFTIGVVGFVPVICRASLDTSVIVPGSGSTNLGTLNEFCNSPGGYRVVADYSKSLTSGRLIVDGSEVKLTGKGNSVVVTESLDAAIASRTVALELPKGTKGGTLSFRIEPR